MVDIKQLRYFVTVAETLHFGHAARRLNLTQPPLNRQVAALEKDLGVRLLERHARAAVLTPAGRQFLADARVVLASLDQACRNAKRAERGEVGQLTIGFMMVAAYHLVPLLTRAYATAFPDVRLTLVEVVPDGLPDALAAGQFDVGILFPPHPIPGLRTQLVHREPLCAAIPSNHPLSGKTALKAADLSAERFIMVTHQAAPTLRDAVANYCYAGGFAPTVYLEVQLQQTIVNLVAEGLGVALVPHSMCKVQTERVTYLPLRDAPVIDQVIAWRDGNLNPALAGLIEIATSLAQTA